MTAGTMQPDTVSTGLAALGIARVPIERLGRMVAASLGVAEAEVTTLRVDVVDYPIGTPSTCALLRCRGSARVPGEAEERSWSIFVKVLQSAHAWEHLHMIPEAFRQEFADSLPWRLEISAHRSTLASVLPRGLRLPRLYDVVEIDDLHAAVWMEDIDVDPSLWALERFERAAELLGRLAARRPVGTHAVLGHSAFEQTPGIALRYYVNGRVKLSALGPLRAEETWSHPYLAAAVESEQEHALREDLLSAGEHVDRWLDLLDALPQTYVHGDASPQNLLVAQGADTEFVVIDWGFHCPQSTGFDLGQLVIGLAHAGQLDAADLPPIIETCVAAYVRGLRSEGDPTSEQDVRTGFVASLVLRAMFTMIPLELMGAPDSPAVRSAFAQRVRLTRYLLTLAKELPA